MKPSCVQMYTEQGMFLLNFVNKVFVSKSLNCKILNTDAKKTCITTLVQRID